MRVKVVGIQNVDYVSKKTGAPVKGITLHVLAKDQRVDGDAAEQVYISDKSELYAVVHVGDQVDIEYNARGFVADARLVAK